MASNASAPDMRAVEESQSPERSFKRLRRYTISTALLAALVAQLSPCDAAENGSTNWPLGLQTVAPALLPPQGGTEYYDYTVYYSANRFNGANGKSAIPGFDLNVVAKAGRIVHTWQTDTGPWNFSSGIILAGRYVDLAVTGAQQSQFGLNYIYATPLYATYNTENFHFLLGPSVFVPTPTTSYSSSNLANATNNFVSFNQEIAFTYFPTPRLEISAEAAIAVNATNPATGYRSGAIANLDFGVNYAPIESLPNLFFGLNGYIARQFEDDTLYNHKVLFGNRLSSNGLGVQAIYYINKATAVVVKYQKQLEVRNGPQGNLFWFEFAVPLPF